MTRKTAKVKIKTTIYCHLRKLINRNNCYLDLPDDNDGYGELNNLFVENEETTLEDKKDNQFLKSKNTTAKEIVITHYIFNGSVIAVTLNGDTIPLKKYFKGDEVYETQYHPHEEYQCPLLYNYTSTELGHLQTLHTQAMKHGRKKKITNYEDEFPGPWRTNGKAYINWVVGPKEVQDSNKSKFKYNHF
jgi:hypothetical protein